jgi:hypothetical protein
MGDLDVDGGHVMLRVSTYTREIHDVGPVPAQQQDAFGGHGSIHDDPSHGVILPADHSAKVPQDM